MTIDESEIRRLANEYMWRGWPGADALTQHHAEAQLRDAIRTALAAEREQHARDVAEARAETWKQVITCARIRASRGETALQLLDALYRKSSARALNDSPRAVADRKDGRKPDHPQVQGSANRRLDSADGGINQGSGAGERIPCSLCEGSGRLKYGGCPRCGGLGSIVPAFPPASAPGGAPGVETACAKCEGGGACLGGCGRAIPHLCDACNGTGTTPTPSTETPTGGR